VTAISHAAEALTSAYDRLEIASLRLLGAVNGVTEDADAGHPLVDMILAKTQARASIAVIRFSDDMLAALLDIR
jgi:hypothetical protein